MKNIERTEVQKKIASTLGDCGTCHLCPFTVDEKICRDHKEWPCSKTMKNEKIDIDAELERNGMHR